MTPCVLPELCWLCGELLVSNGQWVYCCGDQCQFGVNRSLRYDPERDLLMGLKIPWQIAIKPIFHIREVDA